MRESKAGVGYNALTGEYVDMVKEGFWIRSRFSRSALQNATSIAATLLTTESAVSTIKELQPRCPGNPAAYKGNDVSVGE